MKKGYKDIRDMTMLGVSTGVGAKVITGAGGDASALSGMSSMYPTLGTVAGAGMTLRAMKKLKV